MYNGCKFQFNMKNKLKAIKNYFLDLMYRFIDSMNFSIVSMNYFIDSKNMFNVLMNWTISKEICMDLMKTTLLSLWTCDFLQ